MSLIVSVIFQLLKGCKVGHRWTSCGSHDGINYHKTGDKWIAEDLEHDDISGESYKIRCVCFNLFFSIVFGKRRRKTIQAARRDVSKYLAQM